MSIKKYLLQIVLLLVVVLPGQASERIALKLKPGAEYQWDYRLIDDQPQTGKTVSTTPISLKITAETQAGYEAEYRMGETRIDPLDDAVAADPLVQSLTKINKAVVVRLLLDRQGKIVDITNLKEVAAVVDKMTNLLLGQFKGGEQFLPQVKKLFSTKEGISLLYFKDFSLVFSGIGYPVSETPAHSFQTELPNFFGGDPLPATGTVRVVAVNPSQKTIKIAMHQAISAEAVTRLLVAQAKKFGKPIPDAESIKESAKNWQIEDEMSSEIDTRTGLANFVRHQRKTVIEGQSKVEQVEFVLMPQP